MRIRVLNTVVLVLLGTAAACRVERTPRAELPDPEGAARAEIAATLHNYQQALLEGDPRRVASFFTPTAHLYLPGARDIVGRGPIDQTMSLTFAHGRMLEVALRSDVIDVGAGVANQFGTFQQRVAANEGAERMINGRFAIRWVRSAESTWRIERFLMNEAPADSVPAAAES